MTEAREVLRVPRNASREAIKMAYKKLALVGHPDKGGTCLEFRTVHSAYELLLSLVWDRAVQGREDFHNVWRAASAHGQAARECVHVHVYV